jgi:hypothetical protein
VTAGNTPKQISADWYWMHFTLDKFSPHTASILNNNDDVIQQISGACNHIITGRSDVHVRTFATQN